MRFTSRFSGFSERTLQFLAETKRKGKRDGVNRRQDDYLVHVLEPAGAFVSDMGSMLSRVYPGIVADPSTGGSILGVSNNGQFCNGDLARGMHLGIFFWQSPGEKAERPGFYFELDARGLRLYYGWPQFPAEILRKYRDAVADDRRGNDLLRVVRTLKRSGIKIGRTFYKDIPRGWSVGPARAELMRHNALYAELECGLPDTVFSPDLVKYCVRQWKRCRPLYEWSRLLA